MAHRVQTVAVLMIVQGAFEAALGLLFAAFGFFLATGRTALSPEGLPAEAMVGIAVLGPGLLATSALKILGGIRNYSYRGRLLGILGLASGALSVFTCTCAPTAMALLLYGLRVYLDPQAERAFLMGEQGLSREWIKAYLGGKGTPGWRA